MSLTTKKRGNQDYLYDYTKDGGKIKSTYLGKVGDPKTDEKVKAFADEVAKKKEKSKKKPDKVFGDIPVLKETEAAMDKTFIPPGMNKKQIPRKVPARTPGNLPAGVHPHDSQCGLVGRVTDTVNRKMDERRSQKISSNQ